MMTFNARQLPAGLVFLVQPKLSPMDMISGNMGQVLPNGAFNSNGLESTSVTNGGGYWPLTNEIKAITTQYSVLMRVNITTLAAYSALYCIPYRNDATWATPYNALSLYRDNLTGNASHAIGLADTSRQTVKTTTGSYIGTGQHLYGFTRFDGSFRVYKDGVFIEQLGAGTYVPYFGNNAPLTLLNHSSTSPGEGLIGSCDFFAIWNRRLQEDEYLAASQMVGV